MTARDASEGSFLAGDAPLGLSSLHLDGTIVAGLELHNLTPTPDWTSVRVILLLFSGGGVSGKVPSREGGDVRGAGCRDCKVCGIDPATAKGLKSQP